jgi:dihydropyrimidinase
MKMRLDGIIKSGTVIDPIRGQSLLDIGIRDGRIAALLQPGTVADAVEIIDATDHLVFPGLIDAHVHFGFGEPVTEYVTETVYAAQGGFTTILGYLLNNEPYGGIFERELALAEKRALIDFGFHFCTATEVHLHELNQYVDRQGVTSFKYFMNFKGEEGRYLGLDGTDDGYLYRLLEKAASIGDVTVVVHTENIELVNRFRMDSQASGMNTLKDWARVKPPFTEAESVLRAMYFAEHLGARIYIPHLSTRMALDEVRRWRDRYDNVFVETCPHYLTHDDESDLAGMGKANPPFRSKDDVKAMWEGLSDGSINVVASDHVPRKRSTKEQPLWQASQGFPGTATILPVLMDQGYHKGKISLQRIAQVLCQAPASIFNLPQKGVIALGADADFTLVDPNFNREVRSEELGSYSDYSLYDGWQLKGWPRRTIVRGRTVMHNGAMLGREGFGKFISRKA